MKQRILLELKTPEMAAFLLSILLSCIAIGGVVTIGKDAAFYMDIAREVSEAGVVVAFDRFNWPWISVLFAYTHKATGLGFETVAYLYSIFFMAGMSYLLVSMVKEKNQEAAWWAVLLVLSVPVFNGFRDEIIRETGCWFFVVLSIWLVSREKELSWTTGVLFQVAIAFAILYRFEAVFILLAVFFYCIFEFRKLGLRSVFLNLLKVSWIYLLGVGVAVVFLASLEQEKLSRIVHQISLLNPLLIFSSFMETSDKLADVALMKWSYSDAPKILLVGIGFALLYRLITYVGIASFFLVSRKARHEAVKQFAKFRLNTISAVIYFFILYVFFIQVKFVNSRYMALLVILLIPALSVVIAKFFAEYRKWAYLFVVASALVAISNVVSFGDKKTHYLEAAEWLRNNTADDSIIYYEDARVQYYAGRGYGKHHSGDISTISDADKNLYEYFVVEQSLKTEGKHFLEQGFDIMSSFSSKKKTIFILQAIKG